MSQENVDTLRALYEEWGKGDLSGGVEIFDPNVLCIQEGGPPEMKDRYFGPDGIREFTLEWLKPWTKLTIAAEEFIEAENSVVVATHHRGSGQGSGAPVELRHFHVWTFRGRRVIRFDVFQDRAEALEAVGLRE